MTAENLSATVTVAAPAAGVFAVLADPATHAAIDGTGWVREPIDPAPLTEAGQIFRMGMYHNNHPDGDYQMANKVEVLDPPRAIGWLPGQDGPDGRLQFRGLDLAVRPGAARSVRDRGDADLRLVGRAPVPPGAHPVPAVRPGASHQLAQPPGGAGHDHSLSVTQRATCIYRR